MKKVNSLFLIAVGRARVLPAMRKLLISLLILMGIGLIKGCNRDMEALSGEDLLIHSLTLDNEGALQINGTITVAAKVNYSGEAAELVYNWNVKEKEGEIHSKGRSTMIPTESRKDNTNPYETYNMIAKATYVAPEKEGIYTIEFKVCNGAVTVSGTVTVEVENTSADEMTSDPSGTTKQTDSQNSEADESETQG